MTLTFGMFTQVSDSRPHSPFVKLPYPSTYMRKKVNTVEPQWFEHHWNHEKMFETGVVRANECLS